MILFVSIIALTGIWFGTLVVRSEPGAVVEVRNAAGLYREISLEQDATVSVPGPLGDSVVKVEHGIVYMVSSPCPTKVCINMGEISEAGESIVCIPNRVYVLIRGGKSGADSISY